MNSWKLIGPMLVSAVKSGTLSPMRMKPCFSSCSCVLVKTLSGPAYLNSNVPLGASSAVRQQGLVLVVEDRDGALLDGAGEHQGAVGLADQRQVEAERAVGKKALLRLGVRPLQDLVAVGKPAEAHDHRDVAVEDLVKGVERVIRRELLHHPAPLLHAEMLVVERLGMGQRQAEEDPLDRAEAVARADAQPALHQGQAARIAGVHLRRVAVHVARELVEHDHQRDQQAGVLDVQRPVVVVPPRGERDIRAEAVPDILVGLLGLAEPEVEAVLDPRAQHVGEDLLRSSSISAAAISRRSLCSSMRSSR